MSEKLRLCPFCGAELFVNEQRPTHPNNDCLLANYRLALNDIPLWNKRSDLVLSKEEVKQMLAKIRTKLTDHYAKSMISCEESCVMWELEMVAMQFEKVLREK